MTKESECKFSRSNEEKRPDFEEAAKPLIKFLCENYHPMCKIIVDCDSAEILEGEMRLNTDEFVPD